MAKDWIVLQPSGHTADKSHTKSTESGSYQWKNY